MKEFTCIHLVAFSVDLSAGKRIMKIDEYVKLIIAQNCAK